MMSYLRNLVAAAHSLQREASLATLDINDEGDLKPPTVLSAARRDIVHGSS